jgi:hypothetical protein
MQNLGNRLILLACIWQVAILSGEFSFEDYYEGDNKIESLSEEEIILHDLEAFPLAVNSADLSVLEAVPGIERNDVIQLQKIISKRKIQSSEDLLNRGYPPEKLELIKRYITYSRAGDSRANLLGLCELSENRISKVRFTGKLDYGDIKAGLAASGKADEKWKQAFYPCYIEYDCYPYRIFTGYYTLRWGQGLLHAPAYRMSFSKSAGSFVMNSNRLVRGYRGTNAGMFHRGAAFEYGNRNLKAEFFFSEAPVAVNFSDSLLISSFSTEIDDDRQTSTERIYGGALRLHKEKISLGLLAENLKFSHGFEDDKRQNFSAYSLCGEYSTSGIKAGGEIAKAQDKWTKIFYTSYGEKKFEQYLLARSYDNEFPDIHGNPISRKTGFGERGLYYGIRLRQYGWLLNFYTDIYRFPEKRYLIDLPSGGSEQMINLHYGNKEDYLELYGRYRNRDKYHAVSDSGLVMLSEISQMQLSINQVVQNYEIRFRITWRSEYTQELKEYKQGFVMYQQVSSKFAGFRIWARITAFRTQLPIYLYENSTRLSNKQVCLGDDGYRLSIMLKQDIRGMDCELKYYYESRDDIAKAGLAVGISITF